MSSLDLAKLEANNALLQLMENKPSALAARSTINAIEYVIEYLSARGAKEVCAGHIHEGPTSKDCPKCKGGE